MADRNPVEMTKQDVRRISGNLDQLAEIRRSDCALYNSCLEQAISGKWAGFSCAECSAFCERDPHQKMMDLVRLRAIQAAADMVEKYGNAGRVRGVKPGPDAKRTIKPSTFVETVPLCYALNND